MVVRDRLRELQQNSNHNYDSVIEVDSSENTNDESKELFIILEKFAGIREEINMIRINVDSMKSTINESTFHYNDKNIRTIMEERIRDSLRLSGHIHESIKILQVECNLEDQKSMILFRVKSVQLALIKNDYLNVFREHQTFVDNYEEKLKKILKREALILQRQVSEEETERLLISGENSYFVENILEETQKAQINLREIMKRHSELESLERSLVEIRDIFLQVSTLVMEQGALIQVVEYHAQVASMNVEKGGENLEKARELQIKALKKKTCILIWVTAILAVLIFIIIVF